MTDDRAASDGVRSEQDLATELRLRPERSRVTRLSRKVLIGLGAVVAVTIGGVLIFALRDRHGAEQPAELYSTDQKATPDGLAALPRDYVGLPRAVPPLGPPLPGDIGRPIVRSKDQGERYPGVDSVAAAPRSGRRGCQSRQAVRRDPDA